METEISQNNGNFKIKYKAKMIIILISTKRARDTIFVGNKNDTLDTFSTLITRRTQWNNYMEEIISIIAINLPTNYDSNTKESTRSKIITQSTFPFRVCDVSLPQCNTGYVYMLISIKDLTFTYIEIINIFVQEYSNIIMV